MEPSIPDYSQIMCYLWILSEGCRQLIPAFFQLSAVILTVHQNNAICFLAHFPVKWGYQILLEEGGLTRIPKTVPNRHPAMALKSLPPRVSGSHQSSCTVWQEPAGIVGGIKYRGCRQHQTHP